MAKTATSIALLRINESAKNVTSRAIHIQLATVKLDATTMPAMSDIVTAAIGILSNRSRMFSTEKVSILQM